MKLLKYFLVGILFGITLSKGEIISWYRIYEMFRFESFHMYGVIGSAVFLGIIVTQVIKKTNMKDFSGNPIVINPKFFSYPRYLIGGTLFGLGWAMTGGCPGPLFILLGNGVIAVIIIIISAVIGTYVYGLLRPKLPH
jgi:uncharacterized membrane protein YedE/YeeE